MAVHSPSQIKHMASLRRHHMMIRVASNKVGYTAFFYDKVSGDYIGETDEIALSGDISCDSSPVRKYPITVVFKGQTYESFAYEK